MGRVLGKCREGHVNEVAPMEVRCPECRHLFVSKGWMPTALAREILAGHGKELAAISSGKASYQATSEDSR